MRKHELLYCYWARCILVLRRATCFDKGSFLSGMRFKVMDRRICKSWCELRSACHWRYSSLLFHVRKFLGTLVTRRKLFLLNSKLRCGSTAVYFLVRARCWVWHPRESYILINHIESQVIWSKFRQSKLSCLFVVHMLFRDRVNLGNAVTTFGGLIPRFLFPLKLLLSIAFIYYFTLFVQRAFTVREVLF